MTTIAALWVPILLSAVLVFVVSSIIHMAVQLHKGDYRGLPDEERAREALRSVPPGQYMVPHAASMKECGTPEMQQKFRDGPVGVLVMRPAGMPGMGPALGLWFAFCIVIGVFVAYLTGLALAPGASYGQVFRIAATVAFLGHGFTSVNDSIWKGVSWGVTLKFVFDGALYALVTAGTFAWLWPDAA